jgi:hypothetical protein
LKTTTLRPWLKTTLKEVDDLQPGDLMLYCSEEFDIQCWMEVKSIQLVDTDIDCLVVVHFLDNAIYGSDLTLKLRRKTYTAGHLVPVLIQEEDE